MMNKLFRALNDQTRRDILEYLREGDMTAGEIADRINQALRLKDPQRSISKPSVSHHLDLLKQADLVMADKRGQFIHYSLNTTVLDEVLSWLLKFKKK
jgi:ArsR family transcriptional regulator